MSLPADGDPRAVRNQPIGDAVKYTTCYMCACRCGIKVHLKDGGIRYIEGNRDHPVNKGVLCAKGSAGIMQHYSPARLMRPLRRVGPRGSGEFREIDWDEAMATAKAWLGDIRRDDPRKLAFYTGRDQSQSLTGFWATAFGTPNYAAHGGFCSVNMAAAGFYTIGGSFWEFGEPDWDLTRYFLLFGVAEDHDSNPLKAGLAQLKARGVKLVSINPIRTGYSAVADEWLAIRPGTDGLLVLAIIHELLRAGRIDAPYLARYTNAGWLVIDDPGAADHGLFARDAAGRPLVCERGSGRLVASDETTEPDLKRAVQLADGRRAVPSFRLIAERYLDPRYAPEQAAAETGIAAAVIKRLASEIAQAAFASEVVVEQPWTDWTGRQHAQMVGRPVSMHAMRGISAHSNGFHTCRALHLLQLLIGSIDAPGGYRFRPPHPKPIPPSVKPTGRSRDVGPGKALPGGVLGYPAGPDDLLVEPDGSPSRLDKAFSWEAPLAAHGLLQRVVQNAAAGDPYPIDTLFLYMSNASWNGAMDPAGTMANLTARDPETGEHRIPHIIYADAYASEMVAYADLILPDTTYLERWDCISMLDRPICDADAAADAIRQPVIAPNRDVRPFQDVLIDLGAQLGLPGFVDDAGDALYPGLYPDYIANHQRRPGIGLLAGWRGPEEDGQGSGPPNPRQLEAYVEHQCFWRHEIPASARYFKHANRDYLDWAVGMGFIAKAEPIVFHLYSEVLQRFRLAAEGHGAVQPPEAHRARVAAYFDPLPIWYRPFEEDAVAGDAFPLHAITQRPMAMYHSWGSQNAWLRQIHGENRLYLHHELGAELGIADDDWVAVTSHHGRIRVQARLMDGVNRNTIWSWNAIGKRAGAWNLAADAEEATRGFLVNHLIAELLPLRDDGFRYANADPVTGQAAWYDLRVRIEKAEGAGTSEPHFTPQAVPAGLPERPAVLRYGARFRPRRVPPP